MADMKISDLPEAPDINDAQQFEVNDSGNSRRVTFQMLREKIKSLGDTWFAQKTHTHTANQISDATIIGQSLMKAVDPIIARAAIGAGTSNLVLGTEAGMAKPGDWVPDLAAISGGNPMFAQYTAGDVLVVGRMNNVITPYGTNGWYTNGDSIRATSSGVIRVRLDHRNQCAVRKNGVDVASWNSGNSFISRAVDVSVNYGDAIQIAVNYPYGGVLVQNIYAYCENISPLMVPWLFVAIGSLKPPPSGGGGGSGGY